MKKLVNENLKDELISRLLDLIHKQDDKLIVDIDYLRSLPEESIDELIEDYNLIGIQAVKDKLVTN
jgi:hypothetical protein